MAKSSAELLADAKAIWQAGVDSVQPQRLLPESLVVYQETLYIDTQVIDLSRIDRIVVVGGGKAGAGMALGLEAALGSRVLQAKKLIGLLSVPEDCVQPTEAIKLVAGRPAGVNEPRPSGVAATQQMLDLVSKMGPRDLCLCLISGGGSALLPAPVQGLSLDDKIALTRLLSQSGATIEQLNAVRKRLSRIKGGGLARHCRAGKLVSLIISDVLGDPLDVIASGPTVPNRQSLEEALQVFEDLSIASNPLVQKIRPLMCESSPTEVGAGVSPEVSPETHTQPSVQNVILANNATAVDAAGVEAERRGYNHAMDCARQSEGPAEEVGRQLAQMAKQMSTQPGPNCLITGGEPTVTLADSSIRGLGGRNQQLVLAALEELNDFERGGCENIALLSGGTDGEDGPTDAAGAMINAEIASKVDRTQITESLRLNDAYHFFDSPGGLLKTGPTNTNVCDIRVVTVEQGE